MPAKNSGYKSVSIKDVAFDIIRIKAKSELRTVPQYIEFHLGR